VVYTQQYAIHIHNDSLRYDLIFITAKIADFCESQ
jgi:hypothetical protein